MTRPDDHDDDPEAAADFAPSPDELAQMRRATPAQAEAVDALLLGACASAWQPVAQVVGAVLVRFEQQHPELPYLYLCTRLDALADRGAVELAGDVFDMRAAEVRLLGEAAPGPAGDGLA